MNSLFLGDQAHRGKMHRRGRFKDGFAMVRLDNLEDMAPLDLVSDDWASLWKVRGHLPRHISPPFDPLYFVTYFETEFDHDCWPAPLPQLCPVRILFHPRKETAT